MQARWAAWTLHAAHWSELVRGPANIALGPLTGPICNKWCKSYQCGLAQLGCCGLGVDGHVCRACMRERLARAAAAIKCACTPCLRPLSQPPSHAHRATTEDLLHGKLQPLGSRQGSSKMSCARSGQLLIWMYSTRSISWLSTKSVCVCVACKASLPSFL